MYNEIKLAILVISQSLFFSCAMKDVQVKNINLKYSEPLVAKKKSTPIVILADHKNISDTMVTPDDSGVKPITVHGIRTFVKRDFVSFFEKRFTSVRLVENENDLPGGGDYLLVSVKITSLDTILDQASSSNETAMRIFGVIHWSIGLGRRNADSFIYSYNEEAKSRTNLTTVFETKSLIKSTLESAMFQFAQDFDNSSVIKELP